MLRTMRTILASLGVLAWIKPLAYMASDHWNRRRQEAVLAGIVRRDDLVFDIGAFFGSRSFVFTGLGGRVVAVEPNPTCAAWLQRRFGNRGSVRIVPGIASNTAGETTLWIDDQVPEIASVNREWLSSGPALAMARSPRPMSVRSTTLDALIEEFGHPRYIKIDAEGHEPHVLEGLHQRCDYISIELHRDDPDKLPICLTEIGRLGDFRVNLVYENAAQFAFDHWLSLEEWHRWTWDDEAPGTADLFCRLSTD